ncbi:hypothetical protein [Nocardiopsis kunsanensis]|uniref:Uncharacterized protein n=1 Tax=Nocardiopsis kunsanensis TaxID=141693 RepID=A0A918XA10_9ACTN|nr:hypothetical protein [Nocardiopsis kunsanensis]GHD20645.1 hypothetical protein GCM10007147_13280 [Nocardiopsis kunsanensis]
MRVLGTDAHTDTIGPRQYLSQPCEQLLALASALGTALIGRESDKPWPTVLKSAGTTLLTMFTAFTAMATFVIGVVE